MTLETDNYSNINVGLKAMVWKILLLVFVLTVEEIKAHDPDKITNLPGLQHQPKFKHYSGYLKGYFENNYLHYWFVESQRDAGDPVVLWLNGGPGCSSLGGLLTENGPYLIQKDGKTLKYNNESWNKVANVLYLESPAGVGFSYNKNESYQPDDDRTTIDNFYAVQNFFIKFPQFLKNEFYVFGESYGGIYVPLLTKMISQKAPQINLQGYSIGNGLLDAYKNDISVYFYYYYHGFIGSKHMDLITKHCCNSSYNMYDCGAALVQSSQCFQQLATVDIGIVNAYNVYQKCYEPAPVKTFSTLEAEATFIPHLKRNNGAVIPCIDESAIANYLNQANVRSALHIPNTLHNITWSICSLRINSNYKRLYMTMREQILYLNKQNVRGMIYNGDFDTACNFLGDEWFFDNLNLKLKSGLRYYDYSGQVAGYIKEYSNLKFVTVKAAGHMVPTDQPGIAFQIYSYFLKNKDL